MIHSTAIVEPSANIAGDVSIGAYTVIGANVEIGSGCDIASHVVINGPTKIGSNNKIYQFSSIGEDPQDKKYAGEPTLLEIGDNNLIRENVTINRGTVQGGGITKIGDPLFLYLKRLPAYCNLISSPVESKNLYSLMLNS